MITFLEAVAKESEECLSYCRSDDFGKRANENCLKYLVLSSIKHLASAAEFKNLFSEDLRDCIHSEWKVNFDGGNYDYLDILVTRKGLLPDEVVKGEIAVIELKYVPPTFFGKPKDSGFQHTDLLPLIPGRERAWHFSNIPAVDCKYLDDYAAAMKKLTIEDIRKELKFNDPEHGPKRKISLDTLRERAQKQAEKYARALRVRCGTKVYYATLIACGPKVDLTINSLQA